MSLRLNPEAGKEAPGEFVKLTSGITHYEEIGHDSDLFTQQIADLLVALNIDEPIDIIGLSVGIPVVA